MGAVGLATAASDLGTDTRLASARASELPKTVIHPFVGTRVALKRTAAIPSVYHTNDAARPRLTDPPSDSDLTW